MKIPYQVVHPKILGKGSKFLFGISKIISGFIPQVNLNLERARMPYNIAQYVSYCMFNNLILFVALWLIVFLFLPLSGKEDLSLIPPLIVIAGLIGFITLNQLSYPSMVSAKKSRDVEKNLVAALRTFHIELSSGVPLYNAMVTISQEDYGDLSKEFKKVVQDINSGAQQTVALEKMVELSTSNLFRKSMWQIINGMKTGTNLTGILKEIMNNLTEEQVVQIQEYGAKLTPLAMFYMILVVIIPSLSIVFFVLLGSLASLSPTGIKAMFWSVFLAVAMIQYLFISIIRSKRPVLLGD